MRFYWMQRLLLLGVLAIGFVSGRALGADKAAFLAEMKAIRADADAMERLWFKQLPVAAARKGKKPQELRLTLSRGLEKRDFHLVIYKIAGKWTGAKGWAPKWNQAIHQVRGRGFKYERDKKENLFLVFEIHVRFIPDGFMPMDNKPLDGSFKIRLGVNGDRVSGSYQTFTPKVDKNETPKVTRREIAPAGGSAGGTLKELGADAAPVPGLPRLPEGGLDIYELYKVCAQQEIRASKLYADLRAMAIGRKMGLSLPVARKESVLAEPKRSVFDPPAAVKEQKKSKRGVSLDDMIGEDDLGLGEEAPKKEKKKPADPRAGDALARVKKMRQRVEEMRSIAEAFAETGEHKAEWLVDTMTTDDPEFGPWYSEKRLKFVKGVNQLPAGCGGAGKQEWLSVPEWQTIGPFPKTRWDVVLPGFPQVVLEPAIELRVDKDKMMQKSCRKSSAKWEKPNCSRSFCIQWPKTASGNNRVSAGCAPWLGGYLPHSGIEHSTWWYKTTIESPEEQTVWTAIGVNDRGRLWLNGEPFWQGPMEYDNRLSEYVALMKMPFRKGKNELLMRLDVDYSSPYLWMRVCARGKPRDAAAVKAGHDAVAAKRKTMVRDLPAQFRGDGTGLYDGCNPPAAWNRKTRDNVIWFTPLPYWASSTAVPAPGADKVFTTMGPHWLICCSKKDGKVLWKKPATLIDLLPDDLRKKGWALYDKWWKLQQELKATPTYQLDRVPREWSHEWYWAEGTGIWKPGKKKDEREGASPELVALLDQRDKLEKHPNPTEVQEELSKVLQDIDELKEKEGGKDADDPKAKGRQVGKAFKALIGFVGEYSYVRGTSGYWGDYTGHAYATPISDGKHVWVKTGMDVLACFDMDGNRKWMMQIWSNGDTDRSMSSPVMADGKIVIQSINYTPFPVPDVPKRKPKRGKGTKFTAYDALTGKKLWEQRGMLLCDWNCSSPVVLDLTNGKETMKVVVSAGGTVMRLDDGKVLWKDVNMYTGFASVVPAGDTAIFTRPHLCPVKLIMIDRDTVAAKRLWNAESGFHGYDFGGVVAADNRIYTQTWIRSHGRRFGEEGAVPGLAIHGAKGEKWRGLETHDLFTGEMIAKSRLLRKGGHHYSMAAVSAKHIYTIGGDPIFIGGGPKPPMCSGILTRGPDPLLLHNNGVGRTYGAWAMEGDRMYLRSYSGLICVGRTGEKGLRYEAVTVGRKLLDDVYPDRPKPTGDVIEPKMRGENVIKTFGWGHEKFVDHDMPGYSRISSGYAPPYWHCLGPFPIEKAGAAMKAFGGPGAVLNGDDMVTVNGVKDEWGTFSTKHYMKPRNYKRWEQDHRNLTDIHRIRRVVDFGRVLGKDRLNTVTYLVADLCWDEDTVRRFEQTMPGVRAWIGGIPIKHGDRVRFKRFPFYNKWSGRDETKPGYCQLLLEIKVKDIPKHGLWLSPRFWKSDDVKQEEAEWEKAVERRRSYYERVIKLAPDTLEAERAKHVLAELGKK